MQTKEDIFIQIKSVISELFEIEADNVKLSSHLYTDLDLDSIDAVDLVIKLKEMTGKMIEPEVFKSVRTVDDIVETVYKLLHE